MKGYSNSGTFKQRASWDNTETILVYKECMVVLGPRAVSLVERSNINIIIMASVSLSVLINLYY